MIEIRLDGETGSYQGSGPVTIGREPENALTIDDPQISRFHLEIFQRGRDWIARDLRSSNGTVNAETGARITEANLRTGDVLLLGGHRIEVLFDASTITESGSMRFEILEPAELKAVIESDAQNITIGRYPSCEVVLSDPTVSRVHAVVTLTSAGYVLNDQKATNAIFVGTPARRVTSELLHDGDEIRLGAVRMRVQIPEGIGEGTILPELTEATGQIEIIGERPGFELIQARLLKSALFAGFGTDDWRLLLAGYERDPELRVEHYAQGDVLFEAGEFDPYFRIVLAGEVEAFADQDSKPLFRYLQGDCFGHIETKRALPRLARHVASQDSMMLCIPRQHFRYIERNAEARGLLATRYIDESWESVVKRLDIFEGISAREIDQLKERAEIEFFDKPGISLLRQNESGDFFGIVRDGFLEVVREDERGRRIVLGYMRRGEIFGEVALLEDQPRSASVLTGGKAEIIRIDSEDFRTLCQRYPEVGKRLRASRRNREEQSTPELAKRLERSSKGYIQADALLVMDLELCVKCDLCVEACESLHGVSRLTRRGTQVGKYLAPSACRHCEDPVCIHSCPTGAIKRRPEGEIFIDYKTCTGVGACTLACPYGNIQMVDSLIFDQAQARKQRLHPDQEYFRPFPENVEKREGGLLQRLLGLGGTAENAAVVEASSPDGQSDGHKVPPTLPVKCDLCDGLPFMGCVHACPTGAAIRIDPRTLFEGEGVVESGSVIAKAGRGEAK